VDAFFNEEFLGLDSHHLAGDGQEQEEQGDHEDQANQDVGVDVLIYV